MYKITKKTLLAKDIWLMDVEAPLVAESALPGQFVIVIADDKGERIPLTICDYDKAKGTVTIVFQTVGDSTAKMANYNVGDSFRDFVGPLGRESEWIEEPIENLKKKKFIFIAGGVGTAPVYPQVKWLKEHGIDADVIIGARTKDLLILVDEMKGVAGEVFVGTDDGSLGFHGNVTQLLADLVANRGKKYDLAIAIGPMIMMKFAVLKTKELGIPTVVSLNPIMVDGTGMCGACRVTVGGEVKFACVDGPEFDGHKVDFEEAMRRQNLYKTEEGRRILQVEEGGTHRPKEGCETRVAGDRFKRTPISEQPPEQRVKNFDEVCLGYTEEEALIEAARCLNCKNRPCVAGCPVKIQIPDFIQAVKAKDYESAARIIAKDSSLPSVCGRVCPQETQCEELCVLGNKGDPVAIGKLERFVGDWGRDNKLDLSQTAPKKGVKVAVVGSGPSGLSCAGDLAKMGYDVTIFEALHRPGGVLTYGIPDFRLPNDPVVDYEIDSIRKLGVEIMTDVIIGRTVTIDQLMNERGFKAVFVGSGAGLPNFMNIPGENFNGVYSANEFLTRNNLMQAYRGEYDTPISLGDRVAVIGGGNVTMDSARTAKRLGADVTVVYRRSEAEMPARVEEVHHAKEEGIKFELLTNPVEILGDEKGNVRGMVCVRMELGEPDDSGRRRPVPKKGSEFEIPVRNVIMAIGTSPNPLIASTTKGLDVTKWKGIIVEEATGKSSREGIYAGGDAVTGAATVILAMEAGRKAAKAIDEYLREK